MADGVHQTVEEKFATTTTLHGVQYIATSKATIAKFIWLFVFLGGFGLCTWQVGLRIKEYFNFNVNTEILLSFQSKIDFPAVTICNFNRYRKSALTPEEFDIINYLWEVEDYDYYTDLESLDYTKTFGDKPFNTSEFTKRTGFQLDSKSMKSCNWLDNECSADNFTHVFTSYGNCYTFNADKTNSIPLEVKQSGSGNGLQIMIDIGQDEYTETKNGYIEAGLRVLVHDQDEPPMIESKGVSIPPGYHAFLATKKVKVENLGSPHGECNTTRKLEYYNTYTLSGCYIECRLDRILNKCGCRPIRYPGHSTECTPKKTSGCAKDVLQMLKNGTLKECDCPVPCYFSVYETSISYANIPSKSVEDDLTEHYNHSKAYMKENFVLLDVFYEDLNFQVYKQNPAMSFSSLLSDIGGQLGLFIGASVLTFAELGQYIFLKMRALFWRDGNRRNKLRPSTEESKNDVGLADNKAFELE